MSSSQTECAHDDVTWISGEPYAAVSLNGPAIARCNACGMEATLDD